MASISAWFRFDCFITLLVVGDWMYNVRVLPILVSADRKIYREEYNAFVAGMQIEQSTDGRMVEAGLHTAMGAGTPHEKKINDGGKRGSTSSIRSFLRSAGVLAMQHLRCLVEQEDLRQGQWNQEHEADQEGDDGDEGDADDDGKDAGDARIGDGYFP